MIALNEPNAYAAEVPFYLPQQANPAQGVAGVSWTDIGGGKTSLVQYALPSAPSTFLNATITSIIEKGFGRYAYRLAVPGEVSTEGVVALRSYGVAGAQPAFVTEYITQLGGDIPVNGDGVFPFYLPDSANPVYNTGIAGHSFSTGEAKLCLPNGSYANANISRISEIGGGLYVYALLSSDSATALAGKVYLHVDIGSSSQPFDDFKTILGVGGGVSPTPPSPVVVTRNTTLSDWGVPTIDYVALGISRLCQEFKFTKGAPS